MNCPFMTPLSTFISWHIHKFILSICLCMQRLYMFWALNRRFSVSPHSCFSEYSEEVLRPNVQPLYVLSLVHPLCENHASNARIPLADFSFFPAIFALFFCLFLTKFSEKIFEFHTLKCLSPLSAPISLSFKLNYQFFTRPYPHSRFDS